MAMPCTRTPAPGVMKFTNFIDPFLVIITTYLVFLIYVWEKRRFLKKCSNFTLFTPKLLPLWVGVHGFYNFFSPYPTDATY